MTSIAGRKTATALPWKRVPTAAADAEKKDPFEEIDFGSFFQDYLDPGYRSSREMEDIERPSFENFLSKPGSLTDHLIWQLGSISMRPEVEEAVELVIGNLNEDGYLIASDEEMIGVAPPARARSRRRRRQKMFSRRPPLWDLSATESPSDFRQNSILQNSMTENPLSSDSLRPILESGVDRKRFLGFTAK